MTQASRLFLCWLKINPVITTCNLQGLIPVASYAAVIRFKQRKLAEGFEII